MKKEYKKTWKVSGKKSNRNPEIKSTLNYLKTTVESHCNRLEQVEDIISRLEGKIDIYEKTEKSLGKRLEL
jgi:hypothetical protein